MCEACTSRSAYGVAPVYLVMARGSGYTVELHSRFARHREVRDDDRMDDDAARHERIQNLLTRGSRWSSMEMNVSPLCGVVTGQSVLPIVTSNVCAVPVPGTLVACSADDTDGCRRGVGVCRTKTQWIAVDGKIS